MWKCTRHDLFKCVSQLFLTIKVAMVSRPECRSPIFECDNGRKMHAWMSDPPPHVRMSVRPLYVLMCINTVATCNHACVSQRSQDVCISVRRPQYVLMRVKTAACTDECHEARNMYECVSDRYQHVCKNVRTAAICINVRTAACPDERQNGLNMYACLCQNGCNMYV